MSCRMLTNASRAFCCAWNRWSMSVCAWRPATKRVVTAAMTKLSIAMTVSISMNVWPSSRASRARMRAPICRLPRVRVPKSPDQARSVGRAVQGPAELRGVSAREPERDGRRARVDHARTGLRLLGGDDVGRKSWGPRRGERQRAAARLRDSTGLSAEDPLRAVVSRCVPAREAVDANVGAGMRRVHEVSASDVDPDVVEPVEEDEITGLQLVSRNRHGGRVVPLRNGVVRQRDAELAEHVLDETRAVEAARSRPGPYVWDSEILQRHRDHAAVAPAGGAASQGARDERRVARLLLKLAEPRVGGVQAPLEPLCA